jgi:hypothetical protein
MEKVLTRGSSQDCEWLLQLPDKKWEERGLQIHVLFWGGHGIKKPENPLTVNYDLGFPGLWVLIFGLLDSDPL